MNPEQAKELTEAIISSVEVETTFNKEDDTLPYAYYKANSDLDKGFTSDNIGKLSWVCGQDAEGRITSVFIMDLETGKDRKVQYLPDIKTAQFIRQSLIDDGWLKIKDPEFTFSYAGDEDSTKTSLNRRERRNLQKRFRKMNKKNPFNQ
jgi:hypothetical protein